VPLGARRCLTARLNLGTANDFRDYPERSIAGPFAIRRSTESTLRRLGLE
jgi:hypothetical protein